jgi:hypothetical protein
VFFGLFQYLHRISTLPGLDHGEIIGGSMPENPGSFIASGAPMSIRWPALWQDMATVRRRITPV